MAVVEIKSDRRDYEIGYADENEHKLEEDTTNKNEAPLITELDQKEKNYFNCGNKNYEALLGKESDEGNKVNFSVEPNGAYPENTYQSQDKEFENVIMTEKGPLLINSVQLEAFKKFLFLRDEYEIAKKKMDDYFNQIEEVAKFIPLDIIFINKNSGEFLRISRSLGRWVKYVPFVLQHSNGECSKATISQKEIQEKGLLKK